MEKRNDSNNKFYNSSGFDDRSLSYVGVHGNKSRKRKEEKMKFWFSELKEPRRCNACGKTIEKERTAVIFKNTEAEHIKGLARVRLCMECAIKLSALLKTGKEL